NLEQNPSGMMVKTGLVMNTPVSGQYPVFAEYDKTVRTPEINESLLDHKMPVSIGFSLRRYLTDRFSVDAGLLYSYMRSESSLSGTNNDYRYRQDLHYLGIPVSFSLDVLQAKLFRVYISGGGMGEVALSAKGQIDLYSGDSRISGETVHLNAKGLVWSVHGTAGMEYRILRHTGIYLEPGFSYYPENLHQPSSFRTERPFIFDFRLGLRKEF
ncbi:MAG: outer membrane beta-barrel protein, partial [Bacteroidales bacterium]|nr:outer membrane beta-barrel protein [Bacteroidales bacterium]